ncbi:MAG: Abi family protein [Lactobacillaceae bacterium]|jgi:hypothetical protein|nr:Abi family protein [Lactobacillaceae bacterium]
MSKSENKPKMQYMSLIEYSKNKGIKFQEISELDAINYMATKNYYFKLTSYRTNFKQIDGQYQNLDFAHLIDLANIDATLRRFIITTSLNLEHALKVLLINYITQDKDEDGYQIIQDFKSERPKPYTQTITYMSFNHYSVDFYNKHHAEPAVWVFIESMTFGALGQFVDFYSKRNNTKKLSKISRIMQYAKNLRNAAAHSNPILINLFTDRELIHHPNSMLVSTAAIMNIDRSYMSDIKIHDLVALFELTKILNSPETINHEVVQAKRVLDRFDKHPEYYRDILPVQQFRVLFAKMIDFIEQK